MKLVIDLEEHLKGDYFKVYLTENDGSNESTLHIRDIDIKIKSSSLSLKYEIVKFCDFLDHAYEGKKLKDTLRRFLGIRDFINQ